VETDDFDRLASFARPRLLGLAYRMVGSYSEAEDLVQEALLRAHRSSMNDVVSPAAYLTTITTRLAIDHLRKARLRREAYVGPWLPEPIVADPAPDASAGAVLADTLSIAFMVVLETLNPDERAVLVLHDVFAYTHAEIAAMLDRSEASCRQLLRRARQRLAERRPRHDGVDPALCEAVVRRFVAACAGGDVDAFLETLASDVELVFDGGPDVRTAARRPIVGADRAARFLAYVMQRLTAEREVAVTSLNGEPAVLVLGPRGELVGAVFVEPSREGRVAVVRWVRNPVKLGHVH
jgi:RNA polymerase sigma-70 factor, ECF subfamily